MADILVRCTSLERDRIKAKAKAARLSVNAYLLKRGLEDGRSRDSEDSVALATLYAQLLELNLSLKASSPSVFQQEAIALCQQVGREIVLFRLARQVERSS